MILIVGAEGAGKRSFAETLGYDRSCMADAVQDNSPVIFHLEKMVFADPENAEQMLPWLLEKEVVICDEVGSGIIPVDYMERIGRERTGRLCVLLAKQATAVVRVVCGIPLVIKGEL